MTLVIAIACTDGVLVASDSQSTEESGSVRYPVDKVFLLTSSAVWGASGVGQIIREIRETFERSQDVLEATPDMATSPVSLVRPLLEKHYGNFIRQIPGVRPGSPATGLLAAGFGADERPWILEVDHRCQYTYYQERGFHAIGSAAGFAQLANSLMAHFDVKTKPLRYGKLIAYRAIRAAIDTAAAGVGLPIQMWTVTSEGVRALQATDIDAIEADVGGWEEVERSALDEFLGEVESEGPPMPPELSDPNGNSED
jgi:20S proteasome alpha/beta subunit